MVIPGIRPVRADWQFFVERLTDPRETWRSVRGSKVRFYVERTRDDSAYSATVDDITTVLERIPAGDLSGLGLIVLRQPKRKEECLSSAWGRFCRSIDVGDYLGPAVILEAYTKDVPFRWPRRLGPDWQAEINRLRSDGHCVEETRRHYQFTPTLDEVRATQLYRTLPHEIGHWVDWCRKVRDAETPADYGERCDRYGQIPLSEKEAFAHRYADVFRQRMFESGVFPFDRILSPASLDRDGLRRSDFEYAMD